MILHFVQPHGMLGLWPGKKVTGAHESLTADAEEMRIFVAIGQARTLTEAAVSLGIPLFTVSRVLKRIEVKAKLVLIRRGASGLQLTGAGREYLGACLGFLDSLQAVDEVVEKHRKAPEGVLRVSSPVPFAPHVLAPILPGFQKQYPDLRVDITLYCSNWDQSPNAVHDIFLKVKSPRDSRLHQTVFPAIRQGLFASREYLASRGEPTLPYDLEHHACLGQTRDHSAFAWNLSRKSEQVPVRPNYALVVSDIDVLVELVLQSGGIAVLPLWRAHPEVACKRLIRVLPKWTPTGIPFCALHTRRTRMASREAAFLALLGDIVGTRKDPRCNGADPALFFAPIR